jgi:hypothetical protein
LRRDVPITPVRLHGEIDKTQFSWCTNLPIDDVVEAKKRVVKMLDHNYGGLSKPPTVASTDDSEILVESNSSCVPDKETLYELVKGAAYGTGPVTT